MLMHMCANAVPWTEPAASCANQMLLGIRQSCRLHPGAATLSVRLPAGSGQHPKKSS